MHEYAKGNHAITYTDIPAKNPGFAWHDGMVSGNGLNGYVTSGSPYDDVFIFQHMFLNFPSADPRYIPAELTGQLHEARQNVFNLNDKWEVKGADGKKRSRTYYYSFHPGHQLRLCMPKKQYTDYVRWTNHETAETGVRYADERGEWRRVSFTSRADNASITMIGPSSKGLAADVTVTIDDIWDMHHNTEKPKNDVNEMKYEIINGGDYVALVARYPSYPNSELKNGGYAGVTRIIREDKHTYLITEMTRTSDMDNHDILAELLGTTKAVQNKYTADGRFDYDAALAASSAIHGEIYNRAAFTLNADDDLSNEELIEIQRNSKDTFIPAFMQKTYAQGRYAQICCAGHSAPRLGGMWTGDWQPRWRGIYTLDANVNLQVSAMNTGSIREMAHGYIKFILRNAADFELNAAAAYNMTDAIQVSVNSDGDRAMHVEYDNAYPFQYWNAGASWCLLPIYEYWQCFGNGIIDGMDLERDILLPLLTKQANFWEQFVTPEYFIDTNGAARYERGKTALADGETYLLIPCYSPENHPLGYKSTITANATMDIAAARDGLKMAVSMAKTVKDNGWESQAQKWEALASKLTAYKIDTDGALCEWAVREYEERNNHRHISHLYPVWPAYEARRDPDLAKAAAKAVDNRNERNTSDATAGHGWMHKALVEARLGRGGGVTRSLLPMACGEGYYTSLMTDHDTNRKTETWCTDTIKGALGAVHEALVYSDDGEMELLPALPPDWTGGEITGIAARCRATVEWLRWDVAKGTVNVRIISNMEDNKITVSCFGDMRVVGLSNGESVELCFSTKS
jgi:hypothetical protein